MYCIWCGQALSGVANFCSSCGRAVDGAQNSHLAVVDVETTGLHNSDRIVEIAVVSLSTSGEIVDEWDTLVNPGRDVGPTHIHGVTASMVSAAPRFEEIAEALTSRIHGAVLVAHNLAFDTRMLANEYSRVGARLEPGRGVCTLAQCGQRLDDACRMHRVELTSHHRALADARATGQLLWAARCTFDGSLSASVVGLATTACPRTLRRDAVCADAVLEMPYLARLAASTQLRSERGAALIYLDVLDRALDDLIVSSDEWSELALLAASLGMTASVVDSAHRRYFRELVSAAGRDGRITDQEYMLLKKVIEALRLDTGLLEEAVKPFMSAARLIRIQPGMRVCFTGAATYSDGTEFPRERLSAIARGLGLYPVDSVTKKGCDILVAADPNSLSGKASKARGYGLPIVDVRDFACAAVGAAIPAS